MRQKHHKEDEETALLQCSACKYTFSTSNRILAGYPTTNVRSAASKGLGLLLYGTQAATNGETVGAALAAFAARGNRIFMASHETD